jgi:hypothetical protein
MKKAKVVICWILGHLSTSNMNWRMCDRCLNDFEPVFSQYLPTKRAKEQGLMEKVSIGEGFLTRHGWITPEQLAHRV